MPDTFVTRGGPSRPAPKPESLPERTGTVTEEIELRAGVEPIDQLLHMRRGVVEQIANLRAVYGPFGTWEHTRKSELARLRSLVRLQAMKDKLKMSNDQVDDEAHQHPDYTTFVVNATRERADYFRLEARVDDIDFRIERGKSLLYFVSSEARMTP